MPTLPSFAPAPGAAPAAAPAVDGAHVADSASAWDAVFGRRWRIWLVAGAVLVFLAGVASPLADPDFGMHLRIGEWIAEHGRVPTVEPFAWTRAGQPFYAYSWLAEVAYYIAFAALGPLGPRLLHGAEFLAGALAAWAFARAQRLDAVPRLLFVFAHATVVATVAPNLRPHVVLTVAVPLAWAACTALARADGMGGPSGGRARAPWWPYAALFVAAAVAANTHLLAPIVAAPLARLIAPVVMRRAWRPALVAAACVLGGLACTPYAAHWVDVYRVNFAQNALFTFPSPISEHLPGAVAIARRVPLWGPFALWLAVLPWALPRAAGAEARVERVLLAGLWVVGLALFGLAIRGLLVWWLIALPLTAAVFARMPAASPGGVRGALARVPFVLPALLALYGARLSRTMRGWEGSGTSALAAAHAAVAPNARAAVALADTLDRIAPTAAGSRVLTTFNYGNALLWRLPRLSMSVDGRTIFPDSAAKLDGYVLASDSAAIPNVVGSAEVAVLPLRHVLARRLDREPGWRRVAVARFAPDRALVGLVLADTAGLWVTDRWAARWMRRAPGPAPR